MTQTVDVRGLSCPQPVLMVSQAMQRAGSGEIEVLVDNEASRENIARTAQIQGWSVTVKEEAVGNLRLVLKK